jgi:hypothetical protein
MTLRNAPLSGRDGRSNAPDLPDVLSEIFLAGGLDWANQLDRPQEFPFSARRGKQQFNRFAPRRIQRSRWDSAIVTYSSSEAAG